MSYTIFNQGGTGSAVTEFEFYRTLATGGGRYYHYVTEDGKVLFPYCEMFTNFRIVLENGKERCFGREVYYALVRTQKSHRKYCKNEGITFAPQFYPCEQSNEQGEYRTLIPATVENKAVYREIRNSEKAEVKDKSFIGRCYDYVNCTVCRYVLDENGNRVKDERGKAISTKCCECPRTGESNGSRINCCLRHVCTAECWRCPIPKQCNAPQVLGGYDVPNIPDFRSDIEERQFIDEHRGILTEDELAFYQAVYVNEQKPTDYIREVANKTPGASFGTVERQQYRLQNRIKQKAIDLKKQKY